MFKNIGLLFLRWTRTFLKFALAATQKALLNASSQQKSTSQVLSSKVLAGSARRSQTQKRVTRLCSFNIETKCDYCDVPFTLVLPAYVHVDSDLSDFVARLEGQQGLCTSCLPF